MNCSFWTILRSFIDEMVQSNLTAVVLAALDTGQERKDFERGLERPESGASSKNMQQEVQWIKKWF